jgi:hypothetical protein
MSTYFKGCLSFNWRTDKLYIVDYIVVDNQRPPVRRAKITVNEKGLLNESENRKTNELSIVVYV